jgi:thioredoxin-related protein
MMNYLRPAQQRILFAILATCAWQISSTSATGNLQDGWGQDVGKALERAQREDLDVLMLFTGSDWCPPCQKLEQEVLSQDGFKAEAEKRFVLLKLDFLRNSEQEPSIAEQNQKWASEFGVDSFPTIYLLDKNGTPFAIAGYEEGGVENFLGLLEESRQVRIARDEKLDAAEKAKGLDRAKILDEAIAQMQPALVELYYPTLIAEIIELDKNDDLGLRTKWNAANEADIRKAVLTDVMTIARLEKPATAIEFIDEVLTEFEFPIQQKMEILNVKLNLTRQLNEPEKVDALLQEMIEMNGVTPDTQARLIAKKIYLMAGSGRVDDAWQELDAALKQAPTNVYLLKAKGELFDAKQAPADAIKAYDAAIKEAKNYPDLMIELVGAKADAQMDLKLEVEALGSLDQFIDNEANPTDLRAQALLHKSMIMRESNRTRQAMLAENRAVEISQSTQQRREIQKLVEILRARYEK